MWRRGSLESRCCPRSQVTGLRSEERCCREHLDQTRVPQGTRVDLEVGPHRDVVDGSSVLLLGFREPREHDAPCEYLGEQVLSGCSRWECYGHNRFFPFPGVVGPWCVRSHGEPCEQFLLQVPTRGTCWSLGQLLLPDHTPMRLVLTATGPALVEKVQASSHQLLGEPIVDALPLRKR